MSVRQGNKIIAGQSASGVNLFDFKWSDHVLNDASWLHAGTFSWQSGDFYIAAYEHLKTDVKTVYAWISGSEIFYTLKESVAVGDEVYASTTKDSSTIDSVGSDTITFAHPRKDGVYTATRSTANDRLALGLMPFMQSESIDGTTIKFIVANDGHKICPPDQENNVSAIRSKTGAADYFILDTTNKQFKLPRKQKRRLIRAVNNADGTWYNLYSDGWVEQGGFDAATFNNKTFTFPMEMKDTGYVLTLGCGYGSISSQNGKFGITERTTTGFSFSVISLSGNATGANMSWNVSGYAAEFAYASAGMQLEYYYVGNFEQTAIEQIAGINTETFNAKADCDLMNISDNVDIVIESQLPTEENGYTWYRKYKSGWVEQGGILNSQTISAGYSANQELTLPVEMANNSFTITFGALAGGFPHAVLKTRTTTGGTVQQANRAGSGSAAIQHAWYVCGIAA